jgi:hypothetical protein
MRERVHHSVYFAKMPAGQIKIGTTANIPERMGALKAQLLHIVEGSSFREGAIHFLLRASHIENEFFRDDENVRSFIEGSKVGDFRGLVADLPRGVPVSRPTVYPFQAVREALDVSRQQLAQEVNCTFGSLRLADYQVAPHALSGKLVQWAVSLAAEHGVTLGSHHFTGLHTDDLLKRLRPLTEVRVAERESA